MPLEYHNIPAQSNPQLASDELVVSNRATVAGTGYRTLSNTLLVCALHVPVGSSDEVVYLRSGVAKRTTLSQLVTSAGAILQAEKGVANGVATLDAGGLIPTAQLPPLAIGETSVVASQAAMLALTAQTGDVAVRTDVSKTFILAAMPASTLANWTEMLTPAAPVQSVNGYTGTVSLSASDVGAPPTSRTISPGTGLSGGGDLSANRTISLANTSVTPGAYTSADITVDAQGRITAAANGSGGGGGSLTTGLLVYVDANVGNDGTGLRQRADKPFLTLAAASSAASSGDTVFVRPGAYSHNGATTIHKNGVAWHFEVGATVNNTAASDGQSLFYVTNVQSLLMTGAGRFTGKQFLNCQGNADIVLREIDCTDGQRAVTFNSNGTMNLKAQTIKSTAPCINFNGGGYANVTAESMYSSGSSCLDHEGSVVSVICPLLRGYAAIFSRSAYWPMNVVSSYIRAENVEAIKVDNNGFLSVTASEISNGSGGDCIQTTTTAYRLFIKCNNIISAARCFALQGGTTRVTGTFMDCSSGSLSAIYTDNSASAVFQSCNVQSPYNCVFDNGSGGSEFYGCKLVAYAGIKCTIRGGSGQSKYNGCDIYASSDSAHQNNSGTTFFDGVRIESGNGRAVNHGGGAINSSNVFMKSSAGAACYQGYSGGTARMYHCTLSSGSGSVSVDTSGGTFTIKAVSTGSNRAVGAGVSVVGQAFTVDSNID